MIPVTNISRYRLALYRFVLICAVFACMTAYIVFLLIQVSAQERIIKTLQADAIGYEIRIVNLSHEVERMKNVVDVMEREKAISRNAIVHRLTVAEMREIAGTVHAEAQGECSLGKMLVAKVVLNRHRWNPDKSIHEILVNPNAFATGTKYTDADMDAVRAAMLDSTYDNLSGFHNPKTATNPEAKQHKILLTVGQHDFW